MGKEAREKFEKLIGLLTQEETGQLREWLPTLHPADIAGMIEGLEEEEKREVFALLPEILASDVLVELHDQAREQVLEDMAEDRLTAIFDALESHEAADVIADMPKEEAALILSRIARGDFQDVQKLLGYREDTAGGIMQLGLVAVNKEITVRQAKEAVRRAAEKVENIANVYVVDLDNTLVGIMPIRKLLLARDETAIPRLMEPAEHWVTADVDQEEVARIFKKYDLLSLPVVDNNRRLLGRIVVDDVLDVIDAEATEDLYRMGGVHDDERVTDSPLRSVKRRMPWLFINLFTALMAAAVVIAFKDTIQAFVILAAFLPVVAGMGGNAATQTMTVVIRGLAMGDLDFTRTKTVLIKEMTTGLVNGVAIGLFLGLVAYLWNGNYMLGIILALTLIANLFVAGSAGAFVPIMLRKLRVDPASASSVFVTTFTDVFGFFSYLGLATLLLKFLL